MPATTRYLHLHLKTPPARLLERIAARHPDVQIYPDRLVVPLASYRAEEVMAECRRLGLHINASAVRPTPHA